MLNQVSVFTENTKGALRKMTSVLADANINIYTMLANDSAEFGIIRLIVTNPELAVSKLQEAGYQCHMDKVVAVEMGDTPGCRGFCPDSPAYRPFRRRRLCPYDIGSRLPAISRQPVPDW